MNRRSRRRKRRFTTGVHGETSNVRHDHVIADRQHAVDFVMRVRTSAAFCLQSLMDRKQGLETVNSRPIWTAPCDVGTEAPVCDLRITGVPAGLKLCDQRFDRGSCLAVVIWPGDRRAAPH